LARSWTLCPALSPTLQLDLPDDAQTENVGDTLLGDADSVTLAVPSVPLLSQTQMAYLTVVCGSTELTLLRVWTLRHSVPGGGVVEVLVGVGVAVDVGVGVDVDVGVDVGVAIGDFSVPPGLICCCPLVLCAGAGCGSAVGGAADAAGLGCGRTGGLGLWLGWVLGGDGVVCAGAKRTAARSTGMLAGCRAPPLIWLTGRVLGNINGDVPPVEAVGAGLAGAADEQVFVVARLVTCTPLSSMFAAP
jgi:hypothetical protein